MAQKYSTRQQDRIDAFKDALEELDKYSPPSEGGSDMYRGKASYAWQRNIDDLLSIEELSEKQHAGLATLKAIRHFIHKNGNDLFYTDNSNGSLIFDYLFSGQINNLLNESDLPTLDIPVSEFDVTYDETYEDDGYSDIEDAKSANIILIEKANKAIEDYLMMIDRKYGTKASPSGVPRLKATLSTYRVLSGVDLKISSENKKEIQRLEDLQEKYNVGENLRGDFFGSKFDEFAENYARSKLEDDYEDAWLEAVIDGNSDADEYLEAIEKEINENPKSNRFGVDKMPDNPVKIVELMKILEPDLFKPDDDAVNGELNSYDSRKWEQLREKFTEGVDRNGFFDDYVRLIEDIMYDNGFKTGCSSESRISDSRYIDVYEKDFSDEPFSQIRISDHDTHNFYGHHINLYTYEPVSEEIEKLVRTFKEGKFGVNETVYSKLNQSIKNKTVVWDNEKGLGCTGFNRDARTEYRNIFVKMSPRDFLKLTTSKPLYDNGSTAYIEEQIKEDKGIAMPFLIVDYVSDNGYAVTGHEGRHRAQALVNLGIKEMPVIVNCVDFKKWMNRDERLEAIEENDNIVYLFGQFNILNTAEAFMISKDEALRV